MPANSAYSGNENPSCVQTHVLIQGPRIRSQSRSLLVSLACPQVQVDDILSVVQTIPHCDLHVSLTFVMPEDKEFWGKYNEYADTYDKYLLEGWNGNLDVILIFASYAFCSNVFSDFSTYVFRLACSLVSMVGSSSRQMLPCSKIPATISSTCCE